MDKSTNAVAYAPGYYIRDILTTLNISYNDFMVKNSWGKAGKYEGLWYASKAFVRYKTMNIVVNKNALPKEIAKKLEAFFHVEASRWLTLEKQYRMTKK